MRKILNGLVFAVIVFAFIFLFFAVFLSITEYRPSDVEDVEISGTADKKLKAGQDIGIVSWNIGYASLGKECDFVLDGGSSFRNNASKDQTRQYLDGIRQTISELDADIVLLQEVDINSTRSHHINQTEGLSIGESDFAANYKCLLVPFPVPPVLEVHSGLYTTTEYEILEAQRVALPVPFKWPWRVANLKRCLLVNYLPVEGSDKQLVLINLHLEAYDDGEGRKAQMEMLYELLERESAKGNYIIAGGDFNSVFPGSDEVYPIHTGTWIPSYVEENDIPDRFSLVYDLENPSCRLLNQPFNPDDAQNTQYYVIDGFMVSSNIQINSVNTIDLGFENSDHNPVSLSFVLRPEN